MPVDFCGSWIQAIDIWHQHFSGPALLIGAIAIPPMLGLKWFKFGEILVTLLNSAKSYLISFGELKSTFLTRGMSKAASQKCPLDPLKANLESLFRKFLDKKRVYLYLEVYNRPSKQCAITFSTLTSLTALMFTSIKYGFRPLLWRLFDLSILTGVVLNLF